MPRLIVDGFSSIRRADLSLGGLTIMVGPQASGKSLLSKLFYFFNDLLAMQSTFAQEDEQIRDVRDRIGALFKEWFPPSTWGSEPFSIEYSSGPLRYAIKRRESGQRQASNDVKVELSSFYTSHYSDILKRYRSLRYRTGRTEQDEAISHFASPEWRIQRDFFNSMEKELGDRFLQMQIFVPSGRSFFTTLEKAFAILEYRGQAETITSRFGNLYATLLDNRLDFSSNRREDRELEKARTDSQRRAMLRLFNGHLRLSGNRRFLETSDGRRIPFTYMSSGQQELLPLWLVLDYFNNVSRAGSQAGHRTLFIEEPETHLFPSTQSYLVEYLARSFNDAGSKNRLFITTHSPYVLAKINTLLKAGQLDERGGVVARQASTIVPRSAWLLPGAVKAYAIVRGEVVSILDEEDGLVSGSYLDEISNEISSEFLGLLELEVQG